MRNIYMRRGIWLILIGVALNLLGYYLMGEEIYKYGWAMVIGTIAFGFGFLSVIYSLIRKMDRSALLKERAEDAEGE
jgi:Flp pilus assembly protein protease CpaA